MTRLFEEENHVFFCILGGVSHVKNSKKWKWDSGRPPPPCFFKIPTFSRFFWGGASLTICDNILEIFKIPPQITIHRSCIHSFARYLN